jgi:hypothetical protein
MLECFLGQTTVMVLGFSDWMGDKKRIVLCYCIFLASMMGALETVYPTIREGVHLVSILFFSEVSRFHRVFELKF